MRLETVEFLINFHILFDGKKKIDEKVSMQLNQTL